MKHLKIVMAGFLLGLLILSPTVQAQEDLAKKAQNPVGDLISLPFENNTYFGIGPSDTMANALLFKPVYPIKFGKVNLINRFILPYIWLEGQSSPDVPPSIPEDLRGIEIGYGGIIFPLDLTQNKSGLGDTTYQGFFSPAEPGKVIWGLGPVFILPTHTDDALGVDKWSGGLAGVILTMPGNWVVGSLIQNVWSFAGDEDAPDVNSFLFQYFLNYNLPKGWYLTSAPIITADWEADSEQRWTVPFGGGVGRLVRLGKLPVDFKLAGYWNVEKPSYAADWNLQFTVKFLFPKK